MVLGSCGVGIALGMLIHSQLVPPCSECRASTHAPATPEPPIGANPPPNRDDRAKPTPSPNSSPSADVLRGRVAALERENEALRERKLADDPRHYGFSDAELELLARNCEVRSDSVPLVITSTFLDSIEAKPEEREVIERVAAEFNEQEANRMRALLIEVGADMETYDDLEGLHQQLYYAQQFRPVDTEQQSELQRVIAEERAGLRTPPTESELAEEPPYVRFLRGRLSPGDRFADALADALGDERVEQLRTVNGGWSGGGARYSGCPGE